MMKTAHTEVVGYKRGEAAAGQFGYLQDVMEQCNAALVGLSLCELEQGADLEALGVPGVTSLKYTDD